MMLTEEQARWSRNWQAQGLSPRAAGAVAREDLRSVQEIRARGRASWLRTHRVGEKIVAELEKLCGGLPP